MKTDERNQIAAEGQDQEPEWLRIVRQHVRSLKFGSVQITVHDSRVTQVERSEKVRLDAPNERK